MFAQKLCVCKKLCVGKFFFFILMRVVMVIRVVTSGDESGDEYSDNDEDRVCNQNVR